MHGWADDIIAAACKPQTAADGLLHSFFRDTSTSRDGGFAFLKRLGERSVGRDEATTWQTRNAQYDAVLKWGASDLSLLQRPTAITIPVLITNGDDDRMILPWYSYLLRSLIPDSVVKIYPDSAHGFIFQHHQEFLRRRPRFPALNCRHVEWTMNDILEFAMNGHGGLARWRNSPPSLPAYTKEAVCGSSNSRAEFSTRST